MPRQYVEELAIENASLRFRNFSGEEGRYNRAGDRSFCVIIDDPEYAQHLSDIGWNVKILKPRDPDEDPQHYIQVSVRYDNVPPRVKLITRRGQADLDEQSIGSLDYADIENVDLIIHPYHWEVNGEAGLKAYLKTMYVTIREDPFAHKYEREDKLPFED